VTASLSAPAHEAAPAHATAPATAVEQGQPYPLGTTPRDGGLNVAVYSETADVVEICLFDADDVETRVALPERTGHVFHGFLPGVGVGQRYGLRVHGPWDPANGLRHNAAKLLLDPHATAIDGDITWGEQVFGHLFADPSAINTADSAASMPRCVVADPSFDWGDDRAPRTPMAETVVYEAHVKGLTKLHPDVPEEIRGTYKALGHPAITGYLTDLGVTAVELLPVHQFVQDSHLLEKGLRNYWGYNSIGFLAPHADYSSSGTAGEQVAEFKEMVKALHAAGLEVILDVVYNHTAEGNHMGPSLSLKGIDNASYYRLVDEDRHHYFDTTGTGNSLNVSHPAGLQLIMDSLRYWVTEMHVDGFRFDLATTLTRQGGDMDVHSAFLDLCHQDPVLAPVKLIAEPWDTAGYQVGGFPALWSEWNGKFRDGVRDFWRGAEGSLGELALRMTGSPDIYVEGRRDPIASVNFITAHDGFTLADLTAFNEKHNEANGEGNNDGESDNRSWNCGVEGTSDDPEVCALRDRQRRNLLATLMLSAGVPMLLGGDEMGRTQGGNNNAYCQDDEISWFDWAGADTDLQAFTKKLTTLRREHPALRPKHYLPGRDDAEEDGEGHIVMRRADGPEMTDADWGDAVAKALAVQVSGPAGDGSEDTEELLILLNASDGPVEFGAVAERKRAKRWQLLLSTDPEQHLDARLAAGKPVRLRDHSLAVLRREVDEA